MEATEPRKTEPRTAHVERETLTLQEAAARLGVARSSAYDQARRGSFPVPNIGRCQNGRALGEGGNGE